MTTTAWKAEHTHKRKKKKMFRWKYGMITLNIHIHNMHCGKFTHELEEDPEAPEGISKNIQ